jgi:hypothetical protein
MAGALAVAAGLLTACSTTVTPGATTTTAAPTTTVVGGARPAETEAATLRAKLTALLEAHVYLTAVVTSAIVTGADPAPAQSAVTANTADLAQSLAAGWAGSANSFTVVWTSQQPLFAAYTKAQIRGDSAAADEAKKALTTTFESQVGAFVTTNTVNLITSTVQSEIVDPYVTGLLAAVDAQVAKSPTQYTRLQVAAATMVHAADLLAAAQAKQFPKQFPGTATGSAANLRATLTGALVDHAYLTAITTATIIGGGDPAAPSATLDQNSRAVANVFAVTYDDATGQRSYDLWRRQVDDYVAYARAASGDTAGQAKARSDLTAWTSDLGGYVASLDPKLSASVLAGDLGAHVQTLLAVIDAQAARSPGQFTALRRAGQAMVAVGDTLSEGLAEQFPSKLLA